MELATRGPAMSSPSAGAVGRARTATRCHRVRFGRAPIGRDERRASAAGRARTRARRSSRPRASRVRASLCHARGACRATSGDVFRPRVGSAACSRDGRSSEKTRRPVSRAAGTPSGTPSSPPRPRRAPPSSIPASLPAWRRHASVACVMLAVFLHLLGFTVTGPITPSLVRHFALHPSQVGYLTSAYPWACSSRSSRGRASATRWGASPSSRSRCSAWGVGSSRRRGACPTAGASGRFWRCAWRPAPSPARAPS